MTTPAVLITGALTGIVRAEIRQEGDVKALVDATVGRFGRLYVTVNNGGAEGKPGPATEQTAETYAATVDMNVLGRS